MGAIESVGGAPVSVSVGVHGGQESGGAVETVRGGAPRLQATGIDVFLALCRGCRGSHAVVAPIQAVRVLEAS